MTEQLQIDVEKIRILKARYCRFVDTKQWDAFSQLLTEDIVIEFYDPSGTPQMKVEGRDEMVRQVTAYLKNAQTVHQVNHHEIELLTSTTAQAIWSIEDILTFANPADSPFAVIHGYGYYHERYEKKAEEWRITGFRLDRLKLDKTPWTAAEQQTA